MRSARLRHKVIIERLVNVGNTWGSSTLPTWETFARVWAGIEPTNGNQTYDNNKHDNKLIHRVVMRYIRGITNSMRINWAGRYFYINEIVNADEKNIDLQLQCEERVV